MGPTWSREGTGEKGGHGKSAKRAVVNMRREWVRNGEVGRMTGMTMAVLQRLEGLGKRVVKRVA